MEEEFAGEEVVALAEEGVGEWAHFGEVVACHFIEVGLLVEHFRVDVFFHGQT